MLISSDSARSDHLDVGEFVSVRYPTGAAHRLRIIGVYDNNSLAGSYLVDASERRYLPGGLDDVVLVKAAPGVSVPTVAAIARRIAAPYPNAKVQDRTQFIGSELDQLDALLNFITALLGLSIVIAVLGIVNTLALSVIERTRELGLLRAVGLSRRQLRRMIRSESVVVAVYGAVLGTAVGICFGIAITEALRREGVTNLTLPFVRMALFVVLAGLAGVVAAIWPARRAAHLDVLRAIAAD
jgi:putative ABC transport system permease protein